MTPFPPRAPASVPPCPGSSTTTFSVRLGVAGAAGFFGVSCAGAGGAGAGACAFGGAGDGAGGGSCAWPVQAGAANIIAPAISRRIAKKKILRTDRKSTRLNSSHLVISYAVFCLKKKKSNKEHE